MAGEQSGPEKIVGGITEATEGAAGEELGHFDPVAAEGKMFEGALNAVGGVIQTLHEEGGTATEDQAPIEALPQSVSAMDEYRRRNSGGGY
jgi:hypothetical protein